MRTNLPQSPVLGARRLPRGRALMLLATGGLIAALALPASASAACSGARANPDNVTVDELQSATLCLLNRKRAQHGIGKLKHRDDLQKAAGSHSQHMVKQQFFTHDSPNGDTATDRIRKTGYLRFSRSWATGENIAWGAYSRAKPITIVRNWMNSSGHRANILSRNFRHIGVGVAHGAPVSGLSESATYTTDFGRN